MNLINRIIWALAEGEGGGTTPDSEPTFWGKYGTLLFFIVIVGGLIIYMIIMNKRSNAKRQKEIDDLKNSIQIGDRIKTIGGILGTVVEVKDVDNEQQIVIQTGADDAKLTMTIDSQAVYQNLSYMQRQAELEAKRKEEQAQLKAQRNRLKDIKEENKAEEKAEEKTESSDNTESANSDETNDDKDKK